MRTLFRCLAIAVACTLTISGTLAAQDGGKANNRGGLWGGIGLGYGIVGVLDCPGGGCETEGGFSGNARIGLTASPSLRFAVGTNGWYKDVEGIGFSAGLLSLQAMFYPGSGDFFLLAGGGLASIDCEICDADTGAGFLIGGGYDFPINDSGSLALTPYANWIVTTIDSNPYILQFGLGLTFN
ncbi:MAG: hypothetical protein M8844_01070 [marine benthic group bacterium]|jgi:hypothetical protein|nr:hypothetical protein [Gemmatimonadota bacterium]